MTYTNVLWGVGSRSIELTFTGGHAQWGLPVLIWYIRYQTEGAHNLNVYLCSIFQTRAYVKKLCGMGVGGFYLKEGGLKVRPGDDGPIGYIPLSNNSNMAKITSIRSSESSTTGYTQIEVEQ